MECQELVIRRRVYPANKKDCPKARNTGKREQKKEGEIMGRWFVILLAVALTLTIIARYIPAIHATAFTAGTHSVPWFAVVGVGLCLVYNKLTGK